MSDQGVTVVIPAWNEEHRLGATLERYVPVLESLACPFEILIVLDGVKDRTADVASRYAGRGVRTVVFDSKLGKGGAIIEGIKASSFGRVGYVDADGPILPSDLVALIRDLDTHSCVIGSRWLPDSRIARKEPMLRRLAGRVWGSLVRSILFVRVHDTQCGAKFFRREVVVPVLREVAVTNWAFDVSLLYHISKAGTEIRERGVTWSYDDGSHLVLRSAIPRMLLSLIGLRLLNLPVSGLMPKSIVSRFSEELSST